MLGTNQVKEKLSQETSLGKASPTRAHAKTPSVWQWGPHHHTQHASKGPGLLEPSSDGQLHGDRPFKSTRKQVCDGQTVNRDRPWGGREGLETAHTVGGDVTRYNPSGEQSAVSQKVRGLSWTVPGRSPRAVTAKAPTDPHE